MSRVSTLRQEIAQFADQDTELGWHEEVYEGKLYKFPKRALLWSVFRQSSAIRKLLPAYKPFSHRGMKMAGDCPFHSDTWIGAGLDPDQAYEDDLDKHDEAGRAAIAAFQEAKNSVEYAMRDQFSFDFVVLANGRRDTSPFLSVFVYEAMAPLPANTYSSIHIQCQKPEKRRNGGLKAICLPDASVKYDVVAKNADVIITEQGGPLVHLATVSRETGKLLIRVDNAMEKFPPFSTLSINLNTLKISAK